MFGGPNPNLCVRYLEQQRIAPLYFRVSVDGHLQFVETSSETAKVSAPDSLNFDHEDYFIVESMIDANFNHVFVSYGLEWKGTWAAGLWVKGIYPNIQSYPGVYYVLHWLDSNSNGIPETGEITTVASG